MRQTVAKLAARGLFCSLFVAACLPSANAERPSPRHGQTQKPLPAGQSTGSKTLTIGDIVIKGAQRLQGKLDLSSATVSGPNTTVEVPDKVSGSRLTLHADEFTLSDVNKSGQGHIEMRGHIRYIVTQKTPEGERKLNGTAGQGSFRRETRKLALSGGVQCELIDPRLEGPGRLHTGQVTVDLAATPYLYALDGDSRTNDVRFAPRPDAAKKSEESQVGPIHITRWDSGTFQTGKIARFDGTLVVADLRSRAGTPDGQIKARHVQTDFTSSGQIAQARAKDDVSYRISRSISRKTEDGKVENGRQEVTGTSGEALYEPADGRYTLDGAIDATIVNSLSLAEPARLLASRLVVTEPAAGAADTALRYELTGAPNHRRLTFTPRPSEMKPTPPADGAAAPGPAFTLGTVVVTGFQTGVMEPGHKVDVTSDGKQALVLDTTDPRTHSASHLETHHFTATLAPNGEVTEARTEGPVTFHIQQPGPMRETRGTAGAASRPQAGAIQSLDGNAARAVYRSGAQERSIALQGPFTAKVTDPEHLEGPGSVKGQKDDTLALDLLTHFFAFDTPHETIVLDFMPRPLEPEPDKTAPNTPAGKRKK